MSAKWRGGGERVEKGPVQARRHLKRRRHAPPLTIEQILGWIDEHRRLTGRWPTPKSSAKGLPLGETWTAIQAALFNGCRTLPGGLTIGRLLAEHRNLRGPLTFERILAWADAHLAATGEWPNRNSGPVRGVEGETWYALYYALLLGLRGLPGGSSIPRLLAEYRPIRNVHTLPRMTIEQILAWADAHLSRTGSWPHVRSGPIAEAPEETWNKVETALVHGMRGLPEGGSLARLLKGRRGTSAINRGGPLTVEMILAWADAHHAATGRWPYASSGPVSGAEEENWKALDSALTVGSRGLPPGSSLARLLAERRGTRNHKALPRLTFEQVRAWAEEFRASHGRWPSARSGNVAGAPYPGENWMSIDTALKRGLRGLPGGSSLGQVLEKPQALAHLRSRSA